MSLRALVELYRSCECPPLVGRSFSATVPFLPVKSLLHEVCKHPTAQFELLLVDGNDAEDVLPQKGDNVEFQLRLPANSAETFHQNLADLLGADPAISRGQLPQEFFLVEENYYTEDGDEHPAISKLRTICQLIRGLAKLAHYHDQKATTHYLRLVFVQPGRGPSVRPVEIETRVTTEVLNAGEELDTRVVDQLTDPNAVQNAHYPAMVGVFGTCLATFLDGCSAEEAFVYLIRRWSVFLKIYHRDLGTFLSGFAFHKAKVEVAETEIKIADEFSKVISDLTGKLLGIPISLAAVVAISRPTVSLTERVLLLVVLALASLILSQTVSNQRRQFERIAHAKKLVLSSIQGRVDSYPPDLALAVKTINTKLSDDETALQRTLKLFRVLSWAPIAIGVLVFTYLYKEPLVAGVFHVLEVVLCLGPAKSI